MTNTEIWVRRIEHGARSLPGTRTGQWLFNNLPTEAGKAIVGTELDTFHADLSHTELFDWFNTHVILDGDEIIALFNHNHIIWERSRSLTG